MIDERLATLLAKFDCSQGALEAELAPFQNLCFLGEGGRAIVYQATWSGTPSDVVIEFPRVPEGMERFSNSFDDNLEALSYEGEILAITRGVPNLVQLVADGTDSEPPFLVLERLGECLESEVPDQ